jgi:hypothetical protein
MGKEVWKEKACIEDFLLFMLHIAVFSECNAEQVLRFL